MVADASYFSFLERPSVVCDGVVFVVSRMSFGRRLELTRRIGEMARRVQFLAAGETVEKMEASVLASEIDRLYVSWGVREVRGLLIDGLPAGVESLIEAGPEELFLEALSFVKAECGLSDSERKN